MSLALIFVLLALLFVLTLASYVDRVYTEMGKFLSREFQENVEEFESRVEPRLKMDRDRVALSVSVIKHMAMAGIAVLIAYSSFHGIQVTAAEIGQVAVSLVLIIVICQHLLPFIFFSRTRGAWVTRVAPVLRVLIYLVLPVTLVLGFCISVAALSKDYADPEPERPSEAVDALIEAGQEEGILEESDRELIQSVVEFGDKTVHEVMTPRPDIFAVPADITIEKFTDLLRTHPYSRVPVYDGSLDNIVGIVFAHDVLQVRDVDARTQTVRQLMRGDVQFVPETKRVADQLREMQAANNHMAIVVDEYGGVAGVVTIEDLVEEIVGEIRDEHETKADIIQENEHTYIVPGSMDVDRLDDLFGVRPEGHEATTVAGLVTELLGHIPRPGEVVQEDGLRFEVLKSTDRLVETLRVSSNKSVSSKQSA
ncbi:MAG: hemolysin family protein [Terriglobales bacterium]